MVQNTQNVRWTIGSMLTFVSGLWRLSDYLKHNHKYSEIIFAPNSPAFLEDAWVDRNFIEVPPGIDTLVTQSWRVVEETVDDAWKLKLQTNAKESLEDGGSLICISQMKLPRGGRAFNGDVSDLTEVAKNIRVGGNFIRHFSQMVYCDAVSIYIVMCMVI